GLDQRTAQGREQGEQAGTTRSLSCLNEFDRLRAAELLWNFLGRSTEEIRQYRDEWENHGERFGRVEGYVGHGGPGKNRDGMARIPAPELPQVRMRPRKNPPPHAQFGG
ncbi:hypothetical protein AB0C35_42850, partial [Spirillospora sp. NPDC048819]